jgi:hypothetical protein
LAWNFLTSKQRFWITGAGLIAAKLMTGKPLKSFKAIKVVPHGVQPGLVPVKLYSQLEVDPVRDDLAVKLVELRSAMKIKNQELPGWVSLTTMGDEITQILSRAESKFCTPNGSTCTGKTSGLLVRRHIRSGEFHYIGREASTRWASGPDLSMMTDAGTLDPTHETFREYERVVDANYLDNIRAKAKQFSTKLLSRKSAVAECAIRNFKNGKNVIRSRNLRKLLRVIHDLQNKNM